jgi:hypothetical protein
VDVFRNGVRLAAADFTATTGTTVVLANACTVGDTVTTVSFYVSSVLNAIPNTAGSVSSSNIVSGVTLTSPVTAGTPTGVGVLTSGTAQTSPPTTPQYFDFTGIPSWVKRVTVIFSGISLSGTSSYLVQIGTSGGIQNTGYTSSSFIIATAGSAGVNSTAGYIIYSDVAAYSFSGNFVINNITSSTWVSSHTIGSGVSLTGLVNFGGGSKNLSGTLDRVRITTVNGTDTFDAGSINILYE